MEKKYLNNAQPSKLQLRTTKKGDTALIVEFEHPSWEGQYNPSVWLTLTPEYNDSNVKAIRALGATCPEELTPSAAQKLEIKEGPTLVLVDGQPRYINEGRVLKVFDNR